MEGFQKYYSTTENSLEINIVEGVQWTGDRNEIHPFLPIPYKISDNKIFINEVSPALAIYPGNYIITKDYKSFDRVTDEDFNKKFKKCYTNVNFGEAIDKLIRNTNVARIARECWKKKDGTYTVVFLLRKNIEVTSCCCIPNPCFVMTSKQTSQFGWSPSMEDMLASDWIVIEG